MRYSFNNIDYNQTNTNFIPFIKPYKWQFIIAIAMIFAFNISIVLAPAFEGMVTTQLASDVAKSINLSNVNIDFGAIMSYNHHD